MRSTIERGAVMFSYTPLLGFAAAVSFGKLIVYAQLLGVAQFGALGQMLLVSAVFGMVASLGLQSVVSRDLPALIAGRQERRGLRLLAQTIAVAMWIALLCLLAASVGVSLFDLTKKEFALGIVHGWAQLAFLTIAFESRSRLQMMRYARDMAARSAAIALAGTAVAALGFSARDVVMAEIAGTLIFCIAIGVPILVRAQVGLAWLARSLLVHRGRLPWSAALLMCAGSLVMFASFNIDRWVAAETLPREGFGVYAFGWLALLAAQTVQGLLNSGLLPLLSRRRAQSLEGSAYRLTALLSSALLVVGLLAIVPLALVLTALVDRWMPHYGAAQPLWVPLLLAAVFRASDFWSSLLLVVEREGLLLAVQTTAIVVAGGIYLVWLGFASRSPTPVSLAWLAVAAGVLSHIASAAAVALSRSAAASFSDRKDHA